MDIHLLPRPHILPRIHERLTPYFESASPIAANDDAAMSCLNSRLARWRKKIQETYRSLVDRFPIYERLCTQLGSADTIVVHFPDSLRPEDARYSFEHFLQHQTSKHKLWAGICGGLAALGALLMPLPGPNVFFFYPAVRSYSHYRAFSGATSAASRKITYQPNKPLGEFLAAIHLKPRSKVLPLVSSLASELRLPRLPDFYREVILHKHP